MDIMIGEGSTLNLHNLITGTTQNYSFGSGMKALLTINGDGGEGQYLALLNELVQKHDADPTPRADRTGTGTFSVFGRQIRFDLAAGQLPLLTTKKLFTKGILAELLWILSGSTNNNDLVAQGVHIWDEWATTDGELGPVYGAQWRQWAGEFEYFDQIKTLIKNLKEKPNDRGHVVSAWNVAELNNMALRPCHCLFQFYVENGRLSCQLYQRSADIFLGVPFNIASYAMLVHIVAREVGLKPGEFIHTFGDLHLYANHVEQAKEQLRREPRPFPYFMINNVGDDLYPLPGIFDLKPNDFQIVGYTPHPPIKAEVSI